jgi:hypothetical protein
MLALITVVLTQRRMWRSLVTLVVMAWILCTIYFFFTWHYPSPAALSRSYFFLESWQWFEYFGLVMPLLLLGIVRKPLALAATICGTFALLVSICFVHRSGSLMLARLQPLRAFHFVYLVGVLLTGDWLSRQRKRAVAAVAVALLAIVFAAQRFTYPASNQVEWPGLTPRNEWQKAFLWIRANTPQNAIFALDNDYIEIPGEDAQGFRVTAERSALADYFKDGGIASNFPQAANLWLQGSQATARLNQVTDAERMQRLAPLGASWIVLPAHSATGFPCPFVNAEVRVCRLGPF